jgi:hypothetical protein
MSCPFSYALVAQILLIILLHLSTCDVMPKSLSKRFLKIGCSQDQILGLEQIVSSQKNGQKDEMIVSFLSGKKQRRKAKKLLSSHFPELNIHKCKIEDSYCLRLRTAFEGNAGEEIHQNPEKITSELSEHQVYLFPEVDSITLSHDIPCSSDT